jgi:hypothetical protein
MRAERIEPDREVRSVKFEAAKRQVSNRVGRYSSRELVRQHKLGLDLTEVSGRLLGFRHHFGSLL